MSDRRIGRQSRCYLLTTYYGSIYLLINHAIEIWSEETQNSKYKLKMRKKDSDYRWIKDKPIM